LAHRCGGWHKHVEGGDRIDAAASAVAVIAAQCARHGMILKSGYHVAEANASKVFIAFIANLKVKLDCAAFFMQ
jgi:hypothetical protein